MEHDQPSEPVTLVAHFPDRARAAACVDDLQHHGVEAALAVRQEGGQELSDGGVGTEVETEAAGDAVLAGADDLGGTQAVGDTEAMGGRQTDQGSETGGPLTSAASVMGPGVTVGASLGATAGLLASYLVGPVGVAFATGSLLSTLAGASLGSMVGGLFDDGVGGTARARQRPGAVVVAQADPTNLDLVRHLVDRWRPAQIRVHYPEQQPWHGQ